MTDNQARNAGCSTGIFGWLIVAYFGFRTWSAYDTGKAEGAADYLGRIIVNITIVSGVILALLALSALGVFLKDVHTKRKRRRQRAARRAL